MKKVVLTRWKWVLGMGLALLGLAIWMAWPLANQRAGRDEERGKSPPLEGKVVKDEQSPLGQASAALVAAGDGKQDAALLSTGQAANQAVVSSKPTAVGAPEKAKPAGDRAEGEKEVARAEAVAAASARPVLNVAGSPAMAELLAQPVDLSNPSNRAALVAQVKALEEAEKAAIETKAKQLGIPTTLTRANGQVALLRGFEGEQPVYEEPENANAAISTNAHRVRRTAPFSVEGQGMVFGLWESGGVPRQTHQEFGGRVTVRDGTVTSTDHATHVGGTLAGNGTNAEALGMAPAALIDAYSSTNDVSEMLAAGAAFSGEAGKILISNHSYGFRRGWNDDGVTWLGVFSDDGNRLNDVDFGFGRYDSAAATLDGMVYNLPYYLPFFSNGNMRTRGPPAAGATWFQGSGGTARAYDPLQHPRGNGQYKGGYDTMDGRKTAKNIMSIGAANDAVLNGVRHVPSSTITSFSSTGPTDDGRIKPDIVANGASLLSAGNANDSAYYSSSGTSMSAPNAAGSAMLLAELYQRRMGGVSMRASTLKALILHTADDLGVPGPDYFFGWGLMNTEAAAQVIEKQAEGGSNPTIVENVLTAAGSQTQAFRWNGVEPIRVTLCWTDPAAPTQTGHDVRTPAVVNDLNLTVTGPGGTTHLPFVMPYVGDWREEMLAAPATRGVNRVDNVEQVLIEAPPVAGLYTVVVNHLGNLTGGQQPYALIISGGGVPDDVQVMPISGFITEGDAGGPFAPAEKIYTISNAGDAGVAWTAVVNQPWLSVDTSAGTVTPDGEVTVTVGLTAAAEALPVGYHEGRLTLTVDGRAYVRLVSLRVIGYPQLVVEDENGDPLASGSEVDWGEVLMGARAQRTVRLTNAGNEVLNLSSVMFSGANAAEFRLATPAPTVIAAGATVDLRVQFQPLSDGEKVASLSLVSDDAERSPFGLELTGRSGVLPGLAQLTRVINTQVAALNPASFLSMGDYALFVATDATHGRELWRTDGTAAGTYLVKDIQPGPATSDVLQLTRLGEVAFFTATTAEQGRELWRTDGTAAGTAMVVDLAPGPIGSNPSNLTVMNGSLFFSASDGASGTELWRSDGTAVGTVLVDDIFPGLSSSTPSNLTVMNGVLFFTATNGLTGAELWRTNGTSAGTVLVRDIWLGSTGSSAGQFRVVGDVLYFSANDGSNGLELWRTDGQTAGTVMVRNIAPGASGSSPVSLVGMNGLLYFFATTAELGYELWRSDGTQAGTMLVKDTRLGSTGGVSSFTPMVVMNQRLFFAANDGSAGSELWSSDGTGAGTVLFKDLNTGSSSGSPSGFFVHEGKLFFSAFSALGRELWVSDGEADGTEQVRDIRVGSGSSTPASFTAMGSAVLFSADDGVNGRELWRTDGTEAGTYMVGEGDPGVNADTVLANFTDIGGTLYFSANDNVVGAELWRSDGSVAGTQLVRDINVGSSSSSPARMTALGQGMVFAASTSTMGSELHFSDGTAQGTRLVLDIQSGSSSSAPSNLRRVGNQVFFSASTTANGVELWRTDGSTGGTFLVRDINPFGGSNPANLVAMDGMVYFTASDGSTGVELWRSDGTTAGTILVRDLETGSSSSSPLNLVAMDGLLYFSASTSGFGRELWRSDGTFSGTVRVVDLEPGLGSASPSQLTPLNGRLYFVATTSEHGTELWSTDGSEGGTLLVKDIAEGSASAAITGLTVLWDRLLFAATTPDTGAELWVSDGTEEGTVLLKEIRPGIQGSAPSQFVQLGAHVYFTADDGESGVELWRTDGTEAGTELVVDLFPGSFGSVPGSLTVSGKKLFFTATHPQVGQQLFQVEGVFPPKLEIEQPVGVVLAEGSGVELGEVVLGSSGEREVTVRNAGTLPLQVAAVMEGTHAAEFEWEGEAVTLAEGETTTWLVRLRPTALGVRTAQLRITSNDPERANVIIPLTGTAVPPPLVRVRQVGGTDLVAGTSELLFADQALGAPAGGIALEVFNDAIGSQLQLQGITLSGVNAADYRIRRTGMVETLAGGESTTFQIEFLPTAAGARLATLQIASNALVNGVFALSLRGSGVPVVGPEQQIVLGEIAAQRASAGPFRLGAFATSGLPVGYEVLAGPVTVSEEGLFTPTGGVGAVTVRISQSGGIGFGAAESQLVTFSLGEWPEFAQIFSGLGAINMAGITPEGELWTWGYVPSTGILGDTTSIGRITPTVIASAVPWRMVSPGTSHMLGIKSDGSLWSWGSNLNGRLGDGTTTTRSSPTAVAGGAQWRSVSAGGSHSAGVRTDGSLWTWGLNSNGQLGQGDQQERLLPTQVGIANHWSQVACGSAFTVALTVTGELWAFGFNNTAQLGDGTFTQRVSPVRVGMATDWEQIAAGSGFVLAIKRDGTLWSWGHGFFGQLGLGVNTSNRLVAMQVGADRDWAEVRAGSNTATARKRDGSVWAWGSNAEGQLADGTVSNRTTPARLVASDGWRGFCAGRYHTALLAADGRVFVAGEMVGFAGASPRSLTRLPIAAADWVKISGNGSHFLAINQAGQLWGWGTNSNGQLGRGNSLAVLQMERLGGANTYLETAAGSHNFFGNASFAITPDGRLFGAGYNAFNHLGDGGTTTRMSFVQIGGGNGWARVSAGQNHGLALRGTGQLWVWGTNSSGQLGDGTTTARSQPVQVGTDADWAVLAAGSSHSLALKTDGSLWAWGLNTSGQVGRGNTTSPQTAPLRVGADNDWVAIAAGNHSLAVKADGSLWAWGSNIDGQLGLGDNINRSVPTRVGSENHWAKVAASRNSSLALTTDGRIFATGRNHGGILGNGNEVNLNSFTLVAEGGFEEVAMGTTALLARHQDGTLWTAGGATFAVERAGRDWKRMLQVLPSLAPQVILAPPVSARSWFPQATSGLPVQAMHLSGPGEIVEGRLKFTGVAGESAAFMVWQSGDEVAWDAAPPKRVVLSGVHGVLQVWDGEIGDGEGLESGGEPVDFGLEDPVDSTWREFTLVNRGTADLVITEVTASADWELDLSGLGASVPVDGSVQFRARFVPTAEGVREGWIRIASGDPDRPLFEVSVTGLGVLSPLTNAPRVVVQPISVIAAEGSTVRLEAVAVCLQTMSYQWLRNGKKLGGATAASLELAAVDAGTVGEYRLQVTAGRASVRSETVAVTVLQAAPVELLVAAGRSVTLDSGALGEVSSGSWSVNGTPVVLSRQRVLQQQGRRLQLRTVGQADSGLYRCLITAPGGMMQSRQIRLLVVTAPPQWSETAVLPTGIVGGAYRHIVSPLRVDVHRPVTGFQARGLPPGLTIDPQTGEISGRPSLQGEFNVTLMATNARGRSSVRTRMVIDPLPEGMVGGFAGLVARDLTLNADLGGQLSLQVTARGAVSGQLQMGTERLPLRGTILLDDSGFWVPELQVEVARKGRPTPAPWLLAVSFDVAERTLEGSVSRSGEEAIAAVEGWALPFHRRQNPALERAGFHTLALLMDGVHRFDPAVPQGSGFGSFKVGSDGALRLIGRLSDGSALKVASKLGANGEIGVFTLLYGKRAPGSLTGRIVQTEGEEEPPAPNALTGTLSWRKPDQGSVSVTLYPAGFPTVALDVVGGEFERTPYQLGLEDALPGIRLQFSEGGLENSATELNQVEVSMLFVNQFYVVPHSAEVTLRGSAATGSIQGKFLLRDPHWERPLPAVWTRQVSYHGQIVRHPDGKYRGHGYFLLPQLPVINPRLQAPPVLSGWVLLER
jgi:ELWxxDGT repeat protein